MATNKFTPELIAPCGMNCGICKAYLAYTHDVQCQRGKVTHCAGCIPRGKNCYVLRGCSKLRKHEIQSCSQCDTVPCKYLAHLDKRYRERYDMSMVENIKELKTKGIDAFLKDQQQKYRCPNCGKIICVHDRKCYSCGSVKEKKSNTEK